LAIQLSLVREHPTKRDYQSDLALSYSNLGTVFTRLLQWSDAEHCFSDATTIQGRLAAAAPQVANYQRDLSVSYNNLGMTRFNAGNLAEAEAAFVNALAIQRQLVATHPADPSLASALGGIYNNLGLVHQRSDRSSDACGDFERAIAAQRQAYERSPDVYSFRDALSKHYYNYGQLLLVLDRPSEAAAAALGRRGLWSSDPERLLRVTHDLAAACKRMPAGVLRDRYIAEAKFTLNAARDAGLQTLPDFTISPFDVLFTREGFQHVSGAIPGSGTSSEVQ
jgi:tetratricopeptide (TPR) repeat protein